MKKITIAYFGSPDFSARFLEKLLNDEVIDQSVEVKLVVSQEDRPVGRKQVLTPTPVKAIGLKRGLEVLEIENCKSKIENCDLCLLYAFGAIIPKDVLNLPKYGFWCIHPSLLPKYRGTSPMAAALINGDKTTGVTIMKMDDQIDHGPIIVQESLAIGSNDKRPDLEIELTDLGFEIFKKAVILLSASRVNELKTKEQEHEKATYTKKLSKRDGFIEFENLKMRIEKSPEDIFNLFRGLYPWPGIWTILPNGKRLKIIDLELINEKIIIKKVQLEGKNEVDFETFNKAYKVF